VTRLASFILPLLVLACSASASWRWDDPQVQGNALFAAASSTGSSPVVVAVGEHGSLVRSTSPGNWSSHGPVASGATLSAVVWSGNRFIACAPGAGLWASNDGIAWSRVDSAISATRIFRAGNNIVALGASSAWVSGGGAFVERPLAAAGISSYRGAASSGSRILIFGRDGLVATSSDGSSWSKTAQPAGLDIYAAAGGSAGFLIGGHIVVGCAFAFGPFLSREDFPSARRLDGAGLLQRRFVPPR